MHVISRKKLIEKSRDYPDAATPLDTWYRISKKALWTNIARSGRCIPTPARWVNASCSTSAGISIV